MRDRRSRRRLVYRHDPGAARRLSGWCCARPAPVTPRWNSSSARECSTDRTATPSVISAPNAGTVREACFQPATNMSPQPTSVPLSAGLQGSRPERCRVVASLRGTPRQLAKPHRLRTSGAGIFVVSGSHCALDRVAGIGEKLLPERSWYSGLVGVERRRYRCLCRVDEALRAARQVAPARRRDRRTGLQSLRALPRVSAATLGGARAGGVRARRRRRLAKARVVARARLVERPAAEARVRAKRDGKRRRHATAEPRLRRLRKTGPPPITPDGVQSCESACPP